MKSGSLWWLDRRHQRGGVSNVNTVDDVQRQASQRRNSSGPYSKKGPRRDTVTRGGDTSTTSVRQLLRRTLDSTRLDDTRGRQYDSSSIQLLRLTLETQRQHARTAERQLVRLRNFNVRQSPLDTHSDNFNVDYYCGYFRSPREQLSYSSSVPITL